MKRRLAATVAVLCVLGLVTAAVQPSAVSAQDNLPPHLRECGGWGKDVAKARVQEHNAELGKYKLQMFRPRERPDGRWQVWKEECARLDLERDLYSFWRVMALAAGGLFLIAAAVAGILYMGESLGGRGQGQARSLVVNAVFGLLIVAMGLLIWQGALTELFGANNLEIGYFNPFGVPPQ